MSVDIEKTETRQGTLGRGTIALLVLIVLIGGALRFTGVTQNGPFFIDEADYLLEAKWIYTGVVKTAGSVLRWISAAAGGAEPWDMKRELERLRVEVQGHPIFMGRPLHSLLTSLPMFVLGYRWWAGALVSAFFGTATIAALFFLGRRFYGTGPALLAAALLALMGYHVLYSRNSLGEANSVFFIVLSILFYHRSRREDIGKWGRSLGLTGILWGCAIAVNDRWISMLTILWLGELNLWLGEREMSRREKVRRFIWLNGAVFMPLLLFQLPFVIGDVAARVAGGRFTYPSYFSILSKHSLNMQTTGVLKIILLLNNPVQALSDLRTYPYLYWKLCGPALCFGLAGGAAAALYRRRLEDWLCLVWIGLPLVYFSLQIYIAQRYASITLPAAALLSAGLFARVREGGGGSLHWPHGAMNRTGVCAAIILLLASGAVHAAQNAKVRYGYREAATFLKEQGSRFFCTNEVVLRAYLVDEGMVVYSPASEPEMREGFERGVRYYIMDHLTRLWRGEAQRDVLHEALLGAGPLSRLRAIERLDVQNRRSDTLTVIDGIEEKMIPARIFPNPGAGTLQCLFEANVSFDLTRRLVEEEGRSLTSIRLYDLKDYFSIDGDDGEGARMKSGELVEKGRR